MAEHDIQLLKHQLEVMQETAVEVCMLGGIGTGKTFTGALWMLQRVLKYPKVKHMIAANTYTQLVNATVVAFTDLLDQLGVPYTKSLGGAQKYIKINNKTTIYLYSLERYDNIRGIEVASIWIDEGAFAKEEAYKVVKGRLRAKFVDLRQILITTSPNGFNWVWKKFEGKDGILSTKQVALVRARTDDNFFLPDGYYEMLLEEYGGEDSPLAKQELFGQFVSLQSGAVYWAFKREKNMQDCSLDRRYPVYVGMDFNIEEMNAVMMQYIRGKFYVCERVRLTHAEANTYDMAQHLLKNYSQYRLRIIPDSTGASRKTSAIQGQSDHKILTDHGLEVLPTKNPFIRNRQNNINMHFKRKELLINPKLNDLVLEIESVSGRDKEGDISHAAVSMGYVVWHLNPLKRSVKHSGSFESEL